MKITYDEVNELGETGYKEIILKAPTTPEAIMTVGDVIKNGNRKARRRAMRQYKKKLI